MIVYSLNYHLDLLMIVIILGLNIMVLSICKRIFNPHPLIPSPKLGGGEEAEKQGIASAYSLGSP